MIQHQGAPNPKPRLDPLDELVMTVLSQNTSDANTARAFRALKERFPTWDEVFHAPTSELADTIRSGGLADQKAPRIQTILAMIEEREGRLDLGRLAGMPDQDVADYLTTLPGVGPKTAACVLAFALGRAAFPIDTHVHRIATRLGWADPGSAEAAHRKLAPRIPADIRYELHMAFIEHGRTTCKARSPRCSRCVLFDLCPTGPELLAAGDAV